MSQAVPAADAGTAGSPQIGTGGVTHDHHHQMHHAEQGDRKHQAEAIALDGQRANLPSTLAATSLNMAVPEAHPALPLQQHEQRSSAPLQVPPPSPTTSHDAAAGDRGGVCPTLTTIEPGTVGSTAAVEHRVVPPPPHLEKIAPPSPRATTTLPNSSTNTSPIAAVPPHTTEERSHHLRANLSHLPHHQKPNDASTHKSGGSHEGKMLFGNRSAAGSAAHRKRVMANTNAITAYEADLTSKDRATQKDAVRRFLNDAVKTDWQWEWPRPEGEAIPDDAPAEEPDDLEWKERDEWLSGVSDSEAEPNTPASKTTPPSPGVPQSPFRFDSPDGVGDTILKTERDRKRQRKRRLKEEMDWNNGLRCFVERRDAWTGARHVTPVVARAPSPPKRMSFSSGDGSSSTAVEPEEPEEPEDEWEDDDTEIPIAPPLIPPENPMRASIKPDVYNTIYDKVINQQLTPSCPMNLKDVTRSCVQGWKRDGEWPPKPGPESPKTKKRRMSVAALFSTNSRENIPKEKTKENEPAKEEKKEKAGTIRKSFQKILTFGHANGSKTKDENAVTAT